MATVADEVAVLVAAVADAVAVRVAAVADAVAVLVAAVADDVAVLVEAVPVAVTVVFPCPNTMLSKQRAFTAMADEAGGTRNATQSILSELVPSHSPELSEQAVLNRLKGKL